MAFKSFEDIEAWKESCNLSIEIFKLTGSGKISKEFILRGQMKKAAISIPSNIAEGFERGSDKEFARFLYIAKGSAGELRTQPTLPGNCLSSVMLNIEGLSIK